MPPEVWKGSQALGLVIGSSGAERQAKSFVPSCIIDKLPLLALNNTTEHRMETRFCFIHLKQFCSCAHTVLKCARYLFDETISFRKEKNKNFKANQNLDYILYHRQL